MDWRRAIPHKGRVLGQQVRSFSLNAAVRGRARLPRQGHVPGMLSFIVPVYNVEDYLDECLVSLRFQHHRNIEIICVDDGTPDDSIAIVRKHRRRDPRVRLVRRPNGGLSAARNTGVAASRGEFLAFVDSDDTVPPDGYRDAVSSLAHSGSDFAVLPYQRLKGGEISPPARWIRAVHQIARIGVDVDEFPDALANAIMCSKVFRHDFWERLGLSFVEGIIYEDQQVSAEAYARASAFDVLTTPVYDWRIRLDRSSISQAKREVENLRAQFAAANESLQVLTRFASERVVSERRIQLLSNDMPQFTSLVSGASDGFWDLLREELPVLMTTLDREEYVARVPPQQKVLQHLILTNQREAAARFITEGGLGVRTTRTGEEEVGLILYLPLWRDESAEVPDDCFRVAERQTLLRTSVRAVSLTSPSTVTVRSWAFIENLDLSERKPTATARAVTEQGDAVPLVVRTGRDDAIDEHVAPGSGHIDYREGAQEVDVDLSLLGPGTWRLSLEVTVGDTTRTGLLSEAFQGSTAAWRQSACAADGRAAVVAVGRTGPLEITVHDDGVLVHGARWQERAIVVVGSGPVPDHVALDTAGGSPVAKGSPAVVGDRWEVELPLPAQRPAKGEHRPWLQGRLSALVDGETRVVRLAPDRLATSGTAEDTRVVLDVTAQGQATLAVHAKTAVVSDVRFDADAFVVVLQPAGVILDNFRAVFESSPATSYGEISMRTDGLAEVRLPYRETRWGHHDLLLRSGTYHFSLLHRETGSRLVPKVVDPLLSSLPLDTMPAELRLQVQLRAGGRGLALVVAAPLPLEERGLRNQLRLQNLANHGRADEDAVFFRSLYGEVANDSAAVVHEELRRRGSTLTLYWSVQDYSVQIPEGGLPLLEGSREWHEKLGAARYSMFNVHQPMWYRKPAGQVMIQTFHGYPYKGMGQEWWQRSGLPEARISSFLDRAADWDYLVSPAHYATEHLLQAFFRPETAEAVNVLEVGYPRNDVLLDARGDEIRRSTRAALGIADHQTAVLYAPTFRDYLSRDGMTARGTDYFDPEATAEALGPDFVLLLRGHAFQARGGQARIAGHGIIDVTYYPDVTDLCLASDAAILDYSSLRFDYALLRRPMIFLVPDKADYHANRPAVLPFRPTAPGPHVAGMPGLLKSLRNLPGVQRRYADAVETFIGGYLELEDGKASARVVDAVFGVPDAPGPEGRDVDH